VPDIGRTATTFRARVLCQDARPAFGWTEDGNPVARILAVLLISCLVLISPLVGRSLDQPNSILNLYDAFGHGKRGTTFDWGYSALIHYNGKTILFDSGNNTAIFEHNVKALSVDLSKIDFAVLSHYHADHFSGFDYLLRVNPRVKIYLPDEPELGAPVDFKFVNEPNSEFKGMAPEELYFDGKKSDMVYLASGSFPHANKEFVKVSREVAPGIYIIATLAPMMGNFDAYPPSSLEHPELDNLPELSLALKTEKGTVIVTGCSHTKVEEIIKTTKGFVGQSIDLVAGGYHLFPYDRAYIDALAKNMKTNLGVHRVAPAHCTGNLAFKIFKEQFGDAYSYAGLESVVEFSH
jgi:7,8-dihydropterin-6-yl-methyl-4-(beta-D-ribofuranosyl)aminobenzene 5'-phosphate synthase